VKNLEKEVQLLRMLKDLEIKRNAGPGAPAPVVGGTINRDPRLGQLHRGPRGKSESFYVLRTSASSASGGVIDQTSKRDSYRGAVAATAPGGDKWGARSDKDVRTSRNDRDGRRDRDRNDDRRKRGNSLERKGRNGDGGRGGGRDEERERDRDRNRDRDRERDSRNRERDDRSRPGVDRRNTTALSDYYGGKDRGAAPRDAGVPAARPLPQCTPLTNLLEDTPADTLATDLIIVESSESVETALQVGFPSCSSPRRGVAR
jgi:hypothetical protein